MSTDFNSVTVPTGFRAWGGRCGIKDSCKPDLALIVSDVPARVAAVFTQNAVVGAPVTIGRKHAKAGRCRAFVCNSGIANVATGKRGLADAIAMCQAVAEAIDCDPHHVLPFSTGVIGQTLPIEKITQGIGELAGHLDRGGGADASVAYAILTTDLEAKPARRQIKLGSKTVTIGGVAKGSGMVAPNMATMLGFITTDCDISAPLLRRALRDAVNADASFNRITVDTDTSTSDTVAIMANGMAGNTPIRAAGPAYNKFAKALAEVCCALAYQIIADGEGVEHVIRVRVSKAASEKDALRVARSVADSPLVKTAVHGGDPNWGRLAMAVGKSGAKVDPSKLSLKLAGAQVFRRGGPVDFDAGAVSEAMRQPEVLIEVSLGLGTSECEVLGCDLSREYIAINADYTT